MVKITSKEELEDWLAAKVGRLGQANSWGQAIAVRAAMRVLPIALSNDIVFSVDAYEVLFFRSLLISWTALNDPPFNYKEYANAVNTAYLAISDAEISSSTTNGNLRSISAYTAYTSIRSGSHLTKDTIHAVYAASDAANVYIMDIKTFEAIWQSIEGDAIHIEHSSAKYPAMELTSKPIWFSDVPEDIFHEWDMAKTKLLKLDKNYAIWIDWYERRLRGEEAAFDIPHDKDREEDKAILIKLADATDEDFWSKGAEHVNAQLGEWLREARERAQERYGAENAIVNESDEDIFIPNQNTNAITFQRGETGKIAVNQTASSDEILKDADSVERHQLTLEEALEIRRKCETSNAGARLTQLLENYLNSIGQSLEEIKPSMAVQRGEKLRQELAAYDNTDNMLPPVSDEILLALKGWQSAHNMMVGLQPRLNALDTVMLGPDRQPELFPPDDLRKLASDADEAELLEDGTLDVLQETADLAPAIPDHNNRRTIWSVETSKNLIIEAFAIAINNLPAAGAITLGVGTAGFAATGTAVAAAYYLVKYRDWIETRLGNSPTWKSLFITLCDKLEKITPFEPKKPNP